VSFFGLMQDQFATLAAPEPERDFPAKIPPAGLLVRLHLSDSLADALPRKGMMELT
jgi:hypothetical protein